MISKSDALSRRRLVVWLSLLLLLVQVGAFLSIMEKGGLISICATWLHFSSAADSIARLPSTLTTAKGTLPELIILNTWTMRLAALNVWLAALQPLSRLNRFRSWGSLCEPRRVSSFRLVVYFLKSESPQIEAIRSLLMSRASIILHPPDG